MIAESFFCGLNLHKLPAEAAFDAEVAVRHGMIKRRSNLYDLTILFMYSEIASNAAIRADCGCLLLP